MDQNLRGKAKNHEMKTDRNLSKILLQEEFLDKAPKDTRRRSKLREMEQYQIKHGMDKKH